MFQTDWDFRNLSYFLADFIQMLNTHCIIYVFTFILLVLLATGCKPANEIKSTNKDLFPQEIIDFVPYDRNPVFTGTGKGKWDEKIRERGYILREEDGYHLWYTGYQEDTSDTAMHLGYATSKDGITWTRFKDNPVFAGSWVEDMMVLKSDNVYFMFAEGRNDIAHILTSTDKIHWNDHGSLRIYYTNGKPLTSGPYGTPTVFIKDNIWYLFYERNDEAIWLATSKDMKAWTNVRDEPVLEKGPGPYDKFGVAVNQVIQYKDFYYAYYHATAFEDWREWSTNVAVSKNLIDWEKYDSNPIMNDNKSSGILVHDGKKYRLYTMHPEVALHFPKDPSE